MKLGYTQVTGPAEKTMPVEYREELRALRAQYGELKVKYDRLVNDHNSATRNLNLTYSCTGGRLPSASSAATCCCRRPGTPNMELSRR